MKVEDLFEDDFLKHKVFEVRVGLERIVGKFYKGGGEIIEGGKMLRAGVIIGLSWGSGGCVEGGIGIELIHLASLLHDDIIDEAKVRRGMVSLNKRLGLKKALLMGDKLFLEAFQIFFRNFPSFVIKKFVKVVDYMVEGQFEEEMGFCVNERKYFEIISKKTGKLFGLSFFLGSFLNEKHDFDFDFFEDLGERVGIIYQLIDDLKDIKEDFLIGKKTLPFLRYEMISGRPLDGIDFDEIKGDVRFRKVLYGISSDIKSMLENLDKEIEIYNGRKEIVFIRRFLRCLRDEVISGKAASLSRF